RIHAFKLVLVFVEKLLDLCRSDRADTVAHFEFVQAMSVDATPFRFDVEQQCVDLYIENRLDGFGNLLVETFDFLSHGGIEIRSRVCLSINHNERDWGCGWTRRLSARCWLRLSCGLWLWLRCSHGWFASRSAAF